MDNDNGSTEIGSSFTPASNNCSFAQLRPTSEFSRQPAYNNPGITYKQQQVCKRPKDKLKNWGGLSSFILC